MVRASIGRVVIGVAVAVGSVACGSEHAAAQGRMNMGAPGNPFGSSISRRELDKFGEILQLTEAQKEAAGALHSAYQEEFSDATKAMQDDLAAAQQEFMDSKDPAVFTKDLPEQMRKHREKQVALETSFMNDLRALLVGDQKDLWPKVERHHRRTKSLPSGMLAGESVNLLSIVDALDFKEERSKDLAGAIENYEIDLDRAMTERDTERERMQKEQEESMKNFDLSNLDFGAIRKTMQDVRKTGIKVREVNERHARLIGVLLPAELQADFTARVRKATYPEVYKDPYSVKAIDAAMAFDDLTEEQRSGITAIRDAFEREIGGLNDRWAAAIAEEEKDGGGDPFMGFGRMIPGAGGGEKSASEEARSARRELDKSTLTKLKTLLTDEQKDRLPNRENDNPWMMGFGGGGGGGDDEAPPPRRERRRN